MKYLIVGENGQLGREFIKWLSGGLAKSLSGEKVEWESVGSKECDISNLSQALNVFESVKPDVVINCAAYNFVDKAEVDYVNAFKVNAIGARNLAFACNKYNAFLIHYSTDYVFDGKKEGLYTEDDEPNPINQYGKSKLAGEILLKEETDDYLILRVSWVYGEGRNNFIYKLLQWVKNQEYLKIAYDEFSVPTSTRTITDITFKALNSGLKGQFHLTNSGYASRYEWAKEILSAKKIDKFIYPVSKEMFNLPVKRPDFSAMSNRKISEALGREISSWEWGLRKFLR